MLLLLLPLLFLFAPRAEGEARWQLSPSFSLTERYDDNLFLSSAKKGGFITVPSLQVRGSYGRELSALSFNYQAGLELFSDTPTLNHMTHAGRVEYTSQLTAWLKLGLSDALRVTRDLAEKEETTGLRPLSFRTGTNVLSNTLTLYAEPALASRLTPRLSYSHQLIDVAVPEEVDETRQTLEARLRYLLQTERQHTADLSYEVSFFGFSANDGTLGGTDFATHTLRAGYNHRFSPTWSATLQSGLTLLAADTPVLRSKSTVVGGVRTGKSFGESRLTFGYDRRVSSGGGLGGAATSHVLEASAEHPLRPDLSARLTAGYTVNEVQGGTLVGAGVNQLSSAGLALRWQLPPRWSAAASYAFQSNEFERGGRSADFHSAGLTLNVLVRTWGQVSWSYQYVLHEPRAATGLGPGRFDRNRVMLTLTFAPALGF